MKAIWLSLVLILSLGAWAPTLYAQGSAQDDPELSQEERIVISENARKKIPLLVERFRAGMGATRDDASQVERVVRNDLDYSGLFRVTTISLVDSGAVGSGFDALVRASTAMENGRVVLRGELLSLPDLNPVFLRDYRAAAKDYREVAHRFSDDIVLYLTGQQGISRTSIAFVLKQGRSKEIYTVDYDGHNLRAVTNNGSINLSPRFSKDGKRIAYASYLQGDADIYVMDLLTGQNTCWVKGPGVQSSPAWSVQNHLAYGNTSGSQSGIYVANGAGNKGSRLTRGGGINTSPSWSPDGRRMAHTSDRSGNPQIYTMDAEGGNARRLTFSGKWNDLPSWSPDGARIAYASRQDGVFRIFSIDASGLGKPKQLTFGPGSDENPSWAPDSRHLVFSSSRGGTRGLYILNVDTAIVRSLVVGKGDASSPDWSAVRPD